VASKGKSYPIVLNAANEIAVSLFLEEKISFGDIPKIISKALEEHKPTTPASLEEIIDIDTEVRKRTSGKIPSKI
jgi:1-deoxy-D-xylulose-5-phosphate reductoisomerase